MDFLQRFCFDGLLSVSVGPVTNARFVNPSEFEVPASSEVYFGPAARRTPGNLKEDVLGSNALWVDVDDAQKPLATLPPSAVVFSGHGWHLYWYLQTPLLDHEQIERLNKVLIADVPKADPASCNVNRLLRIPGTVNLKEPDKPKQVELKQHAGHVYKVEDIAAIEKLNSATRHKIRTGDSRGYRSRSERDWAILTELVGTGASDELIEHLFQYQPCGDKAREAADQYLSHTLVRVRKKIVASSGTGLEARDDGYYAYGRRGSRRISTFVIQPELLLDASSHGHEDALVGSVLASGYTWPRQTFSRSAFTTIAKMDRECPVAAWQFLGRDEDLRALLPFLLEQLQEAGLPKVAASPVQGLHMAGDKYYFLGDQQVRGGREEFWEGYAGPLAWLPSKREHPTLDLQSVVSEKQLDELRTLTPKLNEPEVLWPMLGWYAATPLKPWLETQGYRFPVLNVVGTKGSGKTTLIQRVFMPLFGQVDPKSYDAGTTRFVTLALMGSSNAVPVAFSEFRYGAVETFIRFILLAYDTGHDPRGRGDQTTVDYPLSAPFSVDGEDLIEDPAARERVVVAHLRPDAIAEGSEGYLAYNEIRKMFPMKFGGYYIGSLLDKLNGGQLERVLTEAREAVFAAFPQRLPDRVRANHIVALFGAYLWTDLLGLERPSAQYMIRAIGSVYDLETGRARTLVDFLVEDVVNACSQGVNGFRWTSDPEGTTVYFQLSSAHSWWLAARRRQGRGVLERDAIRSQLREAPYSVDPCKQNDTWMHGVNLEKAQATGLDVPGHVRHREIKLTF